MDVPVQNDGAVEVFPDKCPKCGTWVRYEHSKEKIDGVHVLGKTTWECGFGLDWARDEEFDRVTKLELGKCRRVK